MSAGWRRRENEQVKKRENGGKKKKKGTQCRRGKEMKSEGQ